MFNLARFQLPEYYKNEEDYVHDKKEVYNVCAILTFLIKKITFIYKYDSNDNDKTFNVANDNNDNNNSIDNNDNNNNIDSKNNKNNTNNTNINGEKNIKNSICVKQDIPNLILNNHATFLTLPCIYNKPLLLGLCYLVRVSFFFV